jgi:hypothetical protein
MGEEGCREGGDDEDRGVNEGESNETQQDGDRRFTGGDGVRRGRGWCLDAAIVGDDCREGSGEEAVGVNVGESNGTRPDGDRRVEGRDGVRRARGYGSLGMNGGRGRPVTIWSLCRKRY